MPNRSLAQNIYPRGEGPDTPGQDWNMWIGEAHAGYHNHKELENLIRKEDKVVTDRDSPGAKKFRKNLPDDIEEEQFDAHSGDDPPAWKSIFRMRTKPPLTS